jgi:hypothetical protein
MWIIKTAINVTLIYYLYDYEALIICFGRNKDNRDKHLNKHVNNSFLYCAFNKRVFLFYYFHIPFHYA